MKLYTSPMRLLAPVALIFMVLGVATTASAQDKANKKKMKAAKAFLESNMRLANYYMTAGQYSDALRHFEAVIDREIALPNKPMADKDGGDEDLFAEDKANKRRKKRGGGKGKRLTQVKLRAHMGAAVASWRMGKEEQADGYAEAGYELAQKLGKRRAIKMFEKLLEDPDEAAERFAPSLEELKERARRAEETLDAR